LLKFVSVIVVDQCKLACITYNYILLQFDDAWGAIKANLHGTGYGVIGVSSLIYANNSV
jgi:hypothetical protein